jgi:hypothetical protein
MSNVHHGLCTIQTVYGQVDDQILTEIPSGGRFHLNGTYLKLKPTWFNLKYNQVDQKYDVIKVFEMITDDDMS